MEYDIVFEAVKDGVKAAIAEQPFRQTMIPIQAFEALNDEGRPVRVIGVVDQEDCQRFLVILEAEDDSGEIYPVVENSVFRKPVAAPPN